MWYWATPMDSRGPDIVTVLSNWSPSGSEILIVAPDSDLNINSTSNTVFTRIVDPRIIAPPKGL